MADRSNIPESDKGRPEVLPVAAGVGATIAVRDSAAFFPLLDLLRKRTSYHVMTNDYCLIHQVRGAASLYSLLC